MTDIKRRIKELERLKRIDGDERTEEELEVERVEIEKYERMAADRLKKIREERGL